MFTMPLPLTVRPRAAPTDFWATATLVAVADAKGIRVVRDPLAPPRSPVHLTPIGSVRPVPPGNKRVTNPLQAGTSGAPCATTAA